MALCTTTGVLRLLCVLCVLLCLPHHGVAGLSCVECNTIQYSGCGYWFSNYTDSLLTTSCNQGTCMISKGTYQGREFYERKCFQGDFAECEAPSELKWQPEFKIDSVICCNATNLCNSAVTSYTSHLMSHSVTLLSTTVVLLINILV